MAPYSDSVLLAVTKDGTIKMGLPPAAGKDNFNHRAAVLGKLENASHVTCSPERELFCVRDGDLYRGPLPTKSDLDWFSIGKKVGKGEWSQVKFLFFHQNGEMFCVTNEGEFYKGPQPNNEHVSWIYGQATKIGSSGWEQCEASCFHPDGSLYIINKEDKIVKGKPPTNSQDYWDWLKSATVAGGARWLVLTHFMSFDSDGKLWTVDKKNGTLYRGYIPSDGRYTPNAELLGWNYHWFPFLSFTTDKIISSIISLEFLTDRGRKHSQTLQVIEEGFFNNKKSTVPFKYKFAFDKTVKVTHSFSHEHGFTFGFDVGATFKLKIPLLGDAKSSMNINLSTTNVWSYEDTNEEEVRLSSELEVEVPPGKAIRVVASVVKEELSVPYQAKVKTLFGFETEIEGMWNGATLYDMTIRQEDYEEN